MNASPLIRFLLLSLVGLAFSACLSLERERPEKRLFLIEVSRPSSDSVSPPVSQEILQVRRISVSPAYEAASFVYRTGQASYESDYYNAFFITPDTMMTGQVTRWLGDSGLFRQVAPLGSQLRGDYLLEGNVSALYGDYRPGLPPQAVIEVQLILMREQPGGPEVLHHANYASREDIRGDTPEALVAAWSQALENMLREAEQDFARVLQADADPDAGAKQVPSS